MEALRDPEDFHELVRVMGDDRSKATVSRMKSECCRILRSRWWKWVLEHPLLGPEDIHQSKSVAPSPFLDFTGSIIVLNEGFMWNMMNVFGCVH